MAAAIRAKFPSANAITTVNAASSITTAVTVVAGDVLVCHTAVSLNGDTGRDLSSAANGVTADGSTIEKHANGQSDGFEQVFWWIAPAAGSYNVVTTVAGGAVDNLEQKVYAISGSDGAAPAVTTFAPTGTGTTSAASVTSPTIPTGGLGLALFTAGSAFGSTGQTTECLGTASSPVWAASSIAGCSTAGANATVNFTAAITTPDWYAGIALAFASAAPVLIAATQSGTADTNSTTKTVPIPAGTSANSVIFCVVQTASNPQTVTTVPSGFAPVTGSPFTITGVSGGEDYSVYWKRSASGEGSGNYTWGFATSTWNMIEAFAVDGCRTTGDPFEDIEQSVSSAGTSIPSLVLTTTDNDMLVFIGLADANTHGTDWNPPTGPGTFTEVIDNDYNGISWYQDTASGSRTVSGATINNNLIHAQMVIALIPEPPPPTINGRILLETGDRILLENSDFLVSEDFAGGLGATLGAATETDTALAVSRRKTKTVGAATSTNTAVGISAAHRRTLTIVTEADTAQTFGRKKTRAVTTAAETDTARPLGRVKTVAPATETDSAQPVVRRHTRALVGPVETDTPGSISRSKRKTVTPATETDTAQPLARRKTRALGTATEADTAVGVTRIGSFGLAAEADAARPVGDRKVVTLAAETDAAQQAGVRRARTPAIATETDAAQPVSARKTRALALAAETDGARILGRKRPLDLATETDLARPVGSAKRKTLTVTTETDSAQPVLRRKTRTVGTATETDTARLLGKRRSLLRAVETDTAMLISKAGTFLPATETDTARPLAHRKIRTVGFAVEADVAQPLGRRHVRTVAVAVETDLAGSVTHAKTRTVGTGLETDLAQPVARTHLRAVTPAVETDLALDVFPPDIFPPAADPRAHLVRNPYFADLAANTGVALLVRNTTDAALAPNDADAILVHNDA